MHRQILPFVQRLRMPGKEIPHIKKIKVRHSFCFNISCVIAEPLSFRIKQHPVVVVCICICFTVSDTGEAPCPVQPFSESSDSTEQVKKSNCSGYQPPFAAKKQCRFLCTVSVSWFLFCDVYSSDSASSGSDSSASSVSVLLALLPLALRFLALSALHLLQLRPVLSFLRLFQLPVLCLRLFCFRFC